MRNFLPVIAAMVAILSLVGCREDGARKKKVSQPASEGLSIAPPASAGRPLDGSWGGEEISIIHHSRPAPLPLPEPMDQPLSHRMPVINCVQAPCGETLVITEIRVGCHTYTTEQIQLYQAKQEDGTVTEYFSAYAHGYKRFASSVQLIGQVFENKKMSVVVNNLASRTSTSYLLARDATARFETIDCAPGQEDVNITESDAGRTAELRRGQRLIVTLHGDFRLVAHDASILPLIGAAIGGSESSLTIAGDGPSYSPPPYYPSIQQYVFEAAATGGTQLSFERSYHCEVPPGSDMVCPAIASMLLNFNVVIR